VALAFYVSGHGLGHASRDIEVINAVARLDPALPIHVRTAAPRWIFERTLRAARATVTECACDTGVVQRSSLYLDVDASLDRAAAFHATLDARAAVEAELLGRRGVRFVVADVPPLGFEAAHRAALPSAALANFTWDWIYAHYPGHATRAAGLVARIQAAHAHATLAWRLPLSEGFSGFPRVLDVPWIARHATRPASEVKRALALPDDRPLALVSFGGYGVEWQHTPELRSERFGLVLTTASHTPPALLAGRCGPGVHLVAEDRLYGTGLRYEDLVAAVDVVVTKPGYGIISECVANRTALLYTSRGDFAEYDVLVRELPHWVPARFFPHDRLYSGFWDDELAAVLAQPHRSMHVRTDGAEVVATAILEAYR
jgi:L-arabinokinase